MALSEGLFFFCAWKKKCAWNDFLAFFSLFSRKETVFHAQFSETFHAHSGVFTHSFTKFFTHWWSFFTHENLKIFTYGLVHFTQGFFAFWSKWKRHRGIFDKLSTTILGTQNHHTISTTKTKNYWRWKNCEVFLIIFTHTLAVSRKGF